ncbi:MAG: hypothetical protein ACJAZ1_000080 [Yoonia sp.]|jgi:hypothetical protein
MLALFAWPGIVLVLLSRYSPQVGLCAAVIGGYLLLPEQTSTNLPMLPRFDKNSVPIFAVALVLLLYHRKVDAATFVGNQKLPGFLPRNWLMIVLIALMCVATFLTIFANGDRLVYGSLVLRPLRFYDGATGLMFAFVEILPLLLARKYLASPDAHKVLLLALCISAFIYAFPALYEVRMSPQLHRDVYGFRATSWLMSLRDNGFRPVVFLNHGLWLGIFLSCGVLAAFACSRVFPRRRVVFLGIGGVLLITLSVSKTFGAFSIMLLLLPVVLFLSMRLQLIVAAAVAGTILVYPLLRGADLVPTQPIINLVEQIDLGRAGSLQFRLINEDILLEKARQRPLTGWGGWSRARVYDETGQDISITDGIWVIIIGERGWLGYIARFGLLCLPTILLALRGRRYKITPATSALALVLAANLIDLIPNATLTPVTWLVAGALVGRLEWQHEAQDQETPEASVPTGARTPSYSRTPPRPGRQTRPSGSYTRDAGGV